MTAIVVRPERARQADRRQESIALSHVRLMMVLLLFVAAIGAISIRILCLWAFNRPSAAYDPSDALLPARGEIVDRNGVVMASTINAWSIGIHADRLLNPPEVLARQFARLMPEHSYEQYLKVLKSGRRFVYLRRRALPELVQQINAIGEPAIDYQREPERLYPQASLASHVLGWTDIDGKGASGMERVLQSRLIDPAQRGAPVTLSIDTRVQAAMESELSAAMAKFSAIGAAGVVLDVRTSEVLALTSLPSFNPNAPGHIPMPEPGQVTVRFNRATEGVYELGSTFKPFTVGMAMDSGIVTSFGQMYDCPKALHAGRFTITDTHPFGRRCSVAEIMKESSNIGTAQIAEQVGAQRQRAFLQRLGFLDRVQVELAERGRTLTPGNNWGQIATMTVGYGHGIAVTPLHLATGYATLFNGGIWRPATLFKIGPGHPLPAGHRVFTEQTSLKMRPLLRLVVLKGTGKKADAPGFRIGGKTGTAEKILNGRYTHGAVVTSFAGVFPMDDPRYVVIAMLDEPKATKDTYGFHTAGWNVAPVIQGVVRRIGPLLGVVPDESREVDLSQVLPYVREEGH
ncbi:peptidoglycan D,D-transpeptidase FtsI family protein [Flavisphingomonas formosensis]|uniref:peptidoglycan D,D-transpeptidase FtsI family protein n=1 Tax=Flavisphingomonas formosensis TaxID=861534 RepID=UPI0012F92775|nr:penicillin-binding protein 2 [Sphingomonas formosensis]